MQTEALALRVKLVIVCEQVGSLTLVLVHDSDKKSGRTGVFG